MIRRNFLVSAATLAALPAVPASASSPGGSHLVERAADFDESAFQGRVGTQAQIKQLLEAVSFHPQFLNNVKNAFNGLQFGFGFTPEEITIVVCPHGPSSVYLYKDTTWAKYRLGEALDLMDTSGRRVVSNQFLQARSGFSPADDPDDANGFYQDVSIETLQRRGTIFLACHTAIEEQARALVKRGFAPPGLSSSEVATDILSSLIPGAIVVPSMVATIAVLQRRYGYAYTTIAF